MSYLVGAAAIGTAAYGGYKAIKSSNAEKRDRQALADERKNRPEYVIPDAFTENLNITGNAASQGIDSAAKDFYSTLATNGLTSSIGAIQSSGGGVNSLQELLNNYNQENERLAVSDAQMKRQNIGDFMNANSALAGQQLIKKFGIPNQRSQNDIASLNNSIYQDQAGVNAGVSDITGAAAAYVASRAGSTPRQKTVTPQLDTQQLATNTNDYKFMSDADYSQVQQGIAQDNLPPQAEVPQFLRKKPAYQPTSPYEIYNY